MRGPRQMNFESEVLRILNKILANQAAAAKQRTIEMATMEEIVSKVTEETTLIGGVKTLVQGLRDQIAAIPGVNPATQAQIDEVFAKVSDNAKALSDAMQSGVTPPVPPTT
jgi:hypothetical protein